MARRRRKKSKDSILGIPILLLVGGAAAYLIYTQTQKLEVASGPLAKPPGRPQKATATAQTPQVGPIITQADLERMMKS